MASKIIRFFDNLAWYWNDLGFYPKLWLSAVAFLFLAGVAGLDGGRVPKAKNVPLEDVRSDKNPRVFFDIEIGEEKVGRIEMELFENIVPITVKNFRALCKGNKGNCKSKPSQKLHYKGNAFHRVIPKFMCQAGDITNGNGSGGESIYGHKFEDEWTNGFVGHEVPFVLSMANSGEDANGSQFFITTAVTPWLDCKHVVFGIVEKGSEVVKTIEAIGSRNGACQDTAVIADCGELKSKST